MKTAAGLVAYARAQLGKPYWYGTYGQAASQSLYNSKKKQYPSYYEWAYAGESGVKVHDCVGLIKGYLWCDNNADLKPVYNPSQDKSANGMYAVCTTKESISSLPEVPGVLVFMNGHVGVYIGDGYVIEARGHKYGVVKTKLSARPWVNWGYCPYVTYEATEEKKGMVEVIVSVLKKGAKGEQVKALQALLIGYGFKMENSGKTYGVDGSFGAATDNAVKAYQKANGLEVDGSVGPATWNKLLGAG